MKILLRSFFCFIVILLGPFACLQQNGWLVHRDLAPTSFSERGGHSYLVTVPLYPLTERVADSLEQVDKSDLRLFDGERELGPNHTLPAKIASDGAGSFDDWNGALVMSTFDNSDPRQNGRILKASYRAFPAREAPVVLLGCSALAALIVSTGIWVFRLWSMRRRLSIPKKRALFASLITGAVVLTAIALHYHGVRIGHRLSRNTISAWGGKAYSARLFSGKPFMVTLGDDIPQGRASDLRVREDGQLIGPAHSLHDDIRSGGGGAYSLWKGAIVFSASDGSDPRTNGRTYRVSYSIFLNSRATWIISALGAGLIMYLYYRTMPSHSAGWRLSARRRAPASEIDAGHSLSVWSLVGHVICYMLALSLIYNSLNARAHDAGGFKINFEYKVF